MAKSTCTDAHFIPIILQCPNTNIYLLLSTYSYNQTSDMTKETTFSFLSWSIDSEVQNTCGYSVSILFPRESNIQHFLWLTAVAHWLIKYVHGLPIQQIPNYREVFLLILCYLTIQLTLSGNYIAHHPKFICQ